MLNDFFASPLLQHTLAELLPSREWQRHLAAMRVELRVRRNALLGALAAYAPDICVAPPRGGTVAWLSLPGKVSETAVVAACAARGVRVGPGQPFRLGESTNGSLRISFASAPADDLVRAAERVGDALRDVTR